MHINPAELKHFVENNPKLVQRKESTRWPGLYVLKYKNNVFYDNLWHLHPLLLECRGLVVDQDYNVIVKPFTKVFNRFENGTDIPLDEEVVATRKVNGFMGCATYRPGVSHSRVIYSTTGSLDSPFVDLIKKHVKPLEDQIKKFPGTTFIFEIVDASDPHIIPEEEGAWLIGANTYCDGGIFPVMESVLDAVATMFACKRPGTLAAPFSDIVRVANECKHEGFMVYGPSGVLKLKSPYYLTTKFLARASDKKLMEGVLAGNKQAVDEEYYPLVEYLSKWREQFLMLGEQGRISVIREFLGRANG